MVDPRQVRTRHALTAALLSMVADESLSSISVAALCERAGVHRTTFYRHASSVEEFAVGVITGELDAIATVGGDRPEGFLATNVQADVGADARTDARFDALAVTPMVSTRQTPDTSRPDGVHDEYRILDEYRQAMIEVLTHVAGERHLYRPLLSSQYGAALRTAIDVRMQHRVRIALEVFAAEGAHVPENHHEIVAFVSGGLVGIIVHWAQSDDTDAEAAAARVQALMPAWWPVR